MSPQTVEDLSEKHPTIHLVRANVCLLRRQAAAGDQLSEGLKGELKFEVDSVSVTVQQGDRMCRICVCVLPDTQAPPGGFPRCRCGPELCSLS